MKKRIMKRQLLAVAMAMALLVPQGVYAAEELQLPVEQLEEQQINESGNTEKTQIHEEGCSLPLEHEGECVIRLEESIEDEEGKIEKASLSGYESDQVDVAKSAKNSGLGLTEDNPMKVPAEELVIVNGIYYGISKDWFEENNPNKETLFFSIEIPDNVTTIFNDGLKDSWHPDKEKNNAVTANDNLGRYNVVSIDFSKATSLKTINNQAAMGVTSLKGVLDLSNTQVTTIGKSAFSGCTGLTGVILPNTLEVLGTEDGSSGSVFNGCTGLQFVRTANSDENTVFELPVSLKVIGKQTFKNAFASDVLVSIAIPENVDTIESEAFYTERIQHISIMKKSTSIEEKAYSGYATKCFYNTSNRLIIFQDDVSLNDFLENSNDSKAKNASVAEVKVQFYDNGTLIREEPKLLNQTLSYVKDSSGAWNIDEDYTLPALNPPADGEKSGYIYTWIDTPGIKLTEESKLNKTSIYSGYAVADPVISPTVNGEVIEGYEGKEGYVYFDLCIPEEEIGTESSPTIGVDVEHALLGDGDGDYKVFFEYEWDRVENNSYVQSMGNTAEIVIDDFDKLLSFDDETSFYVLVIKGKFTNLNTDTTETFYKSWHGKIGISDYNTVPTTYRYRVEAVQTMYNITATTDAYGSITPSGTVSVKKGENQTFTITPNSGYEIDDVLVDNKSVGKVESYTFENVTTSHTIHATFKEKEESGGGSSSGGSSHASNTYYVRYHNDDDIVKDGRFIPGETVTVRGDIFTAPRGKVLAGWSLEENGKVDYKVGDTFRMPGSYYDLYAVWKDEETLIHAAYISGYPDGTVGPDRTIIRAEAATMFYNLLSDKSGTARTFADVPMNQWYANAVTTLAGMGVINGYPDGTFKPDAPITRAEFVTMATNFAKADKGTACSFADVPENMWYYGAIAGATENGWISGYPDGTFGPDRYITRAEVTSVINRMENRAADMMFIVENLNDLRTFSDLPFQHWAYGSMMEAANGHDYTREQENTYEVWTGIK